LILQFLTYGVGISAWSFFSCFFFFFLPESGSSKRCEWSLNLKSPLRVAMKPRRMPTCLYSASLHVRKDYYEMFINKQCLN